MSPEEGSRIQQVVRVRLGGAPLGKACAKLGRRQAWLSNRRPEALVRTRCKILLDIPGVCRGRNFGRCFGDCALGWLALTGSLPRVRAATRSLCVHHVARQKTLKLNT
jgi:hypothetical protein